MLGRKAVSGLLMKKCRHTVYIYHLAYCQYCGLLVSACWQTNVWDCMVTGGCNHMYDIRGGSLYEFCQVVRRMESMKNIENERLVMFMCK